DLLHVRDLDGAADLLADRHRRREAHAVEAVVEREREALHAEHLAREQRDQREREVAMGDRAAERRLLRALHVDVDPLVVAGDVRERVDVGLGDLMPVAGAEDFALGLLELLETGDRLHGVGTILPGVPAPLLLVDAPACLYRAFYALPDTI